MFLYAYCSSVNVYLLFLCSSVPTVPLLMCTYCSYVPLCLLSLCQCVPTVPMFLCTYCSSVNVYLLFLCSSVPTVPLLMCTYCSYVPLCLLFVCFSEPSVCLRSIGGFYVTQVSLIITQVKNKISYHSINRVKILKYRRRVINSFGDAQYSEFESFGKGYHWKIIVFGMGLQHGGQKPVETSGVHFGSLKTFA